MKRKLPWWLWLLLLIFTGPGVVVIWILWQIFGPEESSV